MTLVRDGIKKITICFFCFFSNYLVEGQLNESSPDKSVGNFSGDIQVDYQYYQKDTRSGFDETQKMGLNAWCNFSYTYKNITTGVRYEAFQKPLIGYDSEMEGQGFVHKYIQYKKEDFGITAGNYYAQFGNGIILRTYQDKTLGIDNALNGVKVDYALRDWISITGISGKQRQNFETGNSSVHGADIQISILKVQNKTTPIFWDAGISYVNRTYSKGSLLFSTYPANVRAHAYRTNFSLNGFNLNTELAFKSIDPMPSVNFSDSSKGSAYYLGTSYSIKGFGISAQYKKISNFSFRTEPDALGQAYTLNFIPPLARYSTLKEFNKYPLASNSLSEQGYQFELSYSPKIGNSILLNYSHAKDVTWNVEYYTAIFLELRYTLFRNFKITNTIQNLKYNQIVQGKEGFVHVNAVHVNVDYRINRKTSIDFETQYLHVHPPEETNDWLYFRLNLSLAPKFSFGIADEINVTEGNEHFYFSQFSYSKNSVKFLLNYGKVSPGYQCIGGICRYVRSYKGFGISIIANM